MCVSQVHTDWHVCMGYIHSNDCDQWVQVSYFIPRLSEIHIYVVTLYIFHLYLVPDIYTTAWQAKKRCVFQYKQTKTWRASKEDSKCLTQHEKLQKDIISMYLQENYRITDIGYFYVGFCPCHFTLYFWHLVNQRRFNLEIRQSTDKC